MLKKRPCPTVFLVYELLYNLCNVQHESQIFLFSNCVCYYRYVPDNLELGKHELLAKQQSEVLPKLDKSKSGRSIEQILKKSVPTELSMLDGVPHQPRPRSGPLHALKMAGNGDAQSLVNSVLILSKFQLGLASCTIRTW